MFGAFGRELSLFSHVGKSRGSMRRDVESPDQPDCTSSRRSSHSSGRGRVMSETYEWTSSSSDEGKKSDEQQGLATTSIDVDILSRSCEVTAPGTNGKVNILETLEVEDIPCVRERNGVRFSFPRNSLRCGIGPIAVEQTAQVVNAGYADEGVHDYAFVVVQAVHCLPARCSFDAPLTLDFVVGDDRVRWWWDRKAAREDTLRECKMFSRQTEDEPWQEMDPEDVSVVWDEYGNTCLRARINHFSWFSWGKRTTTTSTNIVSFHWERLVLVFNSTNSMAHITTLPTSFKTSKDKKKSCSLTFCEAGIGFETGKKTEQMMLPNPMQSEIVPAGGMTQLFLEGGSKEMKVVVCFLPDRGKVGVDTAPTQEASPSSGTSFPARPVSPAAYQAGVTGRPRGGAAFPTAATSTWGSDTASAPSSGGAPPMERWPSATWPVSGAAAPDSGAGQNGRSECEQMVYCMTKTLPPRKRLTLLSESVNRKIYIEKNARALETYAMMLADFGSATE